MKKERAVYSKDVGEMFTANKDSYLPQCTRHPLTVPETLSDLASHPWVTFSIVTL